MAAKHWLQRYRTGIAEVGAQHDGLFELTDRIFDAILANQGDASCLDLVERLARVTADHFAEEEADMARRGHADAAAHAASHSVLRRQLDQIAADARNGGSITASALEVMNSYFTDHIRTFDARYAKSVGG
jgi:hemerythrin-like metal-binding protein